jgi:lysozyme
MKAATHILQLQAILLIPEDRRSPQIGPLTRAALNRLGSMDPDAEFTPADAASPMMPVGVHRGISRTGLSLVKHFESCLKPVGDDLYQAYQDGGGVWTIGWGHTGLQHLDGTVHKGRRITGQEADELLAYDMNQFEERVKRLVKVELSDDQHAALVSFDFNTGGLTLRGGAPSTLLKKLNAGDYAGAAKEFPKWNKDNGKVVKGLVRRRLAERALFESDWATLADATGGEVKVIA